MLSPHEQKTTLTLRAADQEKFCLGPQSRPGERAISQYHARVSTDLPLDRQKAYTTVPLEEDRNQLQNIQIYNQSPDFNASNAKTAIPQIYIHIPHPNIRAY